MVKLNEELAPAGRPRPPGVGKVRTLDPSRDHRNREELHQLGGRRQQGQGDSVPGPLALGEDADRAAVAADTQDRPNGLEVGYTLGLGNGSHELQEVPLNGRPEGLVGGDPVHRVTSEDANDEGIPVPHVVCQNDVGRPESIDGAEASAVDIEPESQIGSEHQL